MDSELVSHLTPKILWLQNDSREPITVYIDSPGGNVQAMEAILRLLKLSDQDSSPPCRIITVVTNQAASAAADLLSSGDYAVAYPASAILYHGIRRPADSLPPLTAEVTSFLGQLLRLSNNRYAMELARKIEERFSFRFWFARTHFDGLRAELAKPQLSDLDCFLEYIGRRLSPNAQKVWTRARNRHVRYRSLFDSIRRKAKVAGGNLTKAQLEAQSIKAIVDFEVKANKKNSNWTFSDGGLNNLADDFFLLNEYLSAAGHDRLRAWSMKFGKFLLATEAAAEIDAIQDKEEQTEKLVEKVQPILEPLWSFFVALCHALQNDENDLTAIDAYWLGLVDEVAGSRSFLLSPRWFVEFTPDQPANSAPERSSEPPALDS